MYFNFSIRYSNILRERNENGQELVIFQHGKNGRIVLNDSATKFNSIKDFSSSLTNYPEQMHFGETNLELHLENYLFQSSSAGYGLIIYNSQLLEKIGTDELYKEDDFPIEKFIKDVDKILSIIVRNNKPVRIRHIFK